MEAVFESEHVLDGVDDAGFCCAALAADVLEVLPRIMFLQSRAALVKERCRQQHSPRLKLVQGPLPYQAKSYIDIRCPGQGPTSRRISAP